MKKLKAICIKDFFDDMNGDKHLYKQGDVYFYRQKDVNNEVDYYGEYLVFYDSLGSFHCLNKNQFRKFFIDIATYRNNKIDEILR